MLAQQYYSSLGILAPRPLFIGDRLWYEKILLKCVPATKFKKRLKKFERFLNPSGNYVATTGPPPPPPPPPHPAAANLFHPRPSSMLDPVMHLANLAGGLSNAYDPQSQSGPAQHPGSPAHQRRSWSPPQLHPAGNEMMSSPVDPLSFTPSPELGDLDPKDV